MTIILIKGLTGKQRKQENNKLTNLRNSSMNSARTLRIALHTSRTIQKAIELAKNKKRIVLKKM